MNHKSDLRAFSQQQGKLLKRARKEKKVSQEEVAAFMGVSQNMISKYELGHTPVPPYYLSQFSRIYDKPLTFFFMVNPQNIKHKKTN